MTFTSKLAISVAAFGLLTACSGQTVDASPQEPVQETTTKAESTAAIEQMTREIPAGKYVSENTHAYIAFTYSHQGYSKPIVRWSKFDATLNLDNEAPENSTLSVNIDPASIDSGVEKFNDHLKSADFFDVAQYPNIAFTSTSMSQMSAENGTVTGELTMHGVTKPLTLDVTLNKVGKSRGGDPKFGISATGELKRSEWGIDTYAPMADDVKLMIEVEFEKAE